MHAWLSKPLDWMAIQLASRGFTSPQEETCPVGSLAELAPAHDFDTKVRLGEARPQLAPV